MWPWRSTGRRSSARRCGHWVISCRPTPRPDRRPSTSGRIASMQPTRSLTRPAPRAAVYQMAYFPPDQYEQAWAQGLLNATSYRDHGDYRRETEQTMQALADRSASPIHILPMDVADLLAYAQRTGKDPAARPTRLAYTGWLHETGHTGVLWPPERNSPCWCGSATKYKKCCGNPVFLAVEPPDPAAPATCSPSWMAAGHAHPKTSVAPAGTSTCSTP